MDTREEAELESTKRVWPALLGFVVIAALFYLFAATWMKKNPGFDTDQWFHLALSRAWAEQGLTQGVVRSLPQVEDLQWGRYFPEKEFLFHVFTTGAYILGGEPGIRIMALGLALTLLALLYFFLQQQAGVVRAIVLIVPLLLMTPCFSLRLLLVRAYLAAMLFVVALAIAFWKQWPWAAAIAAAGYALSYHAFIIPLVLCLPALLLSRRFGPKWARTAKYSLGGLAVGYLVNSYFPANILTGWQHALFALQPSLPPGMEAGGELVQRRWEDFFICYYPHLLLLGFCGWLIRTVKEREVREKCLFFWCVTLAFWILTLKNPRASEYAVSLTPFVAGICLARRPIRDAGRARWGLIALTACALFFPLLYWLQLWRMPVNRTYQEVTRDIRQGLAQIPPDRPAKVLNCDWGLGAYILYFRPDLHFVDLLDARFLRESKPRHFDLLAALKAGRVPDARGAIVDVFHAQYVLCQRPDLNAQLNADPAFTRLFHSGNSPVEVFSVAQETPAEWVTSLRTSAGEVVENRDPQTGRVSPWISLYDQNRDCLEFDVPDEEISRHENARSVGVGGGPVIEVSLNNQPLHETSLNFPHLRLLQTRLDLPHPLRPGDRLSLRVCRKDSAWWGVAVSLWNEKV